MSLLCHLGAKAVLKTSIKADFYHFGTLFKDFSYVLKHFAKDLPMHIEHRFYFVSLFCELLIPSGSAPMAPALRASIITIFDNAIALDGRSSS